MPVFSHDELEQKRPTVINYLQEHFNITNPSLKEQKYNNDEYGFEVTSHTLPRTMKTDETFYVDNAKVQIATHVPL